uniref:Uncharacterized protein n=1 Tax=Arundo donax TaxID=35708 RepID=A0A0A9DWH9_ARUDO
MAERASGRPPTDPGPPAAVRSEARIHSSAGDAAVKCLVPANTKIAVQIKPSVCSMFRDNHSVLASICTRCSMGTPATKIFSIFAAGSDREGCSTGSATTNFFSLEAAGPHREGMQTKNSNFV